MADQVSDLHAAIMSLPCNTLHAGSPDYQAQAAYGRGFKDARHKAAELAASHAAEVEAMREALRQIAAIKPSDVNQHARGWVDHCQSLARAALKGDKP